MPIAWRLYLPEAWTGRGRPPTLLRRSATHHPASVKTLAMTLPRPAWKTVTWRTGSQGALRSRFAAVHVRPAHRDDWRSTPHPAEWLLIEWPAGEPEPTKYWLGTVAADLSLRELVRLAKHRWIVERDYEELKQELGLGHSVSGDQVRHADARHCHRAATRRSGLGHARSRRSGARSGIRREADR